MQIISTGDHQPGLSGERIQEGLATRLIIADGLLTGLFLSTPLILSKRMNEMYLSRDNYMDHNCS